MDDFLNALRHRPNAFEMRYQKTFYPDAIKQYWSRVGSARESAYYGQVALDTGSASGDGNSAEQRHLAHTVSELANMLLFTPYDDEGLAKAITENEKAIKAATHSLG